MKSLLASIVFAFAQDSQAAQAPIADSIRVPLSAPIYSKASLEDFREPGDRGVLEFQVSSWVPASLRIDAPGAQASPFGRALLPALAIAYQTTPYFQGSLGSLALGLGLRFMPLQRTGTAPFDGAAHEATQAAYVGSFEGRLLARPSLLQANPWQGELGLSVLPTLGAVTRSVLSEERNATGVMLSAQAALAYAFSSWRGAQLRLGVEQVFGGVGYALANGKTVDWDLSGLGATFSMRLPL